MARNSWVYSYAAARIKNPRSRKKGIPPKSKAGIPNASRIKAVMVRLTMHLAHRLRYPSIATVTLSEGLQSAVIFLSVEIRPIGRCDIPFRIGCLPDQKVAAAQLTRRADDQIRVRDAGSVHIPADQFVIDLVRRNGILDHMLDGIDNFIPAAIVEGHVQHQP